MGTFDERPERVIRFHDEGPVRAVARPVQAFGKALHEQIRSIWIYCYRDYTGQVDYGNGKLMPWDGGEDSQGNTHKAAVWPKIANRIIEVGADPLEYIRAQFYGNKNQRAPKPNMLHGDAAVAIYIDYVRSSRSAEELTRKVERELISIRGTVLMYVRINWPEMRAQRYALTNISEVDASPLTRYCISVQSSQNDLSRIFHDRALLQYVLQQRDCAAAYKDLIPVELRQEAAEFRLFLGLPPLAA